MNKLISIIVPIYNIEDYLTKCVESLIAQSYENIEIILVDDGSTDNSSSICDYYKERDKRVVLIHKENAGLVEARKTGLSYAHGEYILNVDGDDWINVETCEKLLKLALEANCDIADASFCAVYSNSDYKRFMYDDNCFEIYEAESKLQLLEIWLSNQMNRKIHSSVVGKLFKREVFYQVYSAVPNNMSYGEDMIAFINSLVIAGTICVTSELLYYYNIRESSISHNLTKDIFYKSNQLDEYLYKTILEYFPKIDKELMIEWYINRKRGIVYRYDHPGNIIKNLYTFPNIDELSGDVVIYGAGSVGSDYYKQLSSYKRIRIVAWVDKMYQYRQYEYCDVENITKCVNEKCDFVLIAVYDEALSKEIKNELISMGVKEEIIVWAKPQKQRIELITEDVD